MLFILMAIVAVAAIVVSGMSAVHGTTVITTGPATITPATSVDGCSLFVWLLVIAVIGLCGWWLFRRRRS
ncbi:MAG: hypothetical protein WCI51_16260 [Lentisphaerota bacterium]